MSVIKNSSLELPDSITKGNLVIGTDKINYGPTSVSGYYSGVSVPENGYVFYRTTSGGKLNAFIANNDSELISIVNRLSNNDGIVTAQDALNWLFNNPEYFIKNKELPNIKTDDLVVYLDTGLFDSYPKYGEILEDISINNHNAQLFNTPTYSTEFGGLLGFDDTSLEYGTIPDIGDLSTWTVEVWFRLTTSLSGKVTSIITNEFNLSDKLNFSIGTNNAPTNRNLAVGFYDGLWHTTSGFVPVVDTWYQVVGTYDGSVIKQYVNGVASGGALNYVGNPQSGGEIRLMRRWDGALSGGNLVNGDLAIVRIYNSALTPTQVLQNYNAEKDRFIDLTPISGAILYYDPSNPSSYIGTGTTVNDLSGNGLTGTLSNVTHTSPEFNFNGTSSQISVADNALLEPGSGDWTMEAWVYLSNTTGSKVILGRFDNGGGSDDVSYSMRVSGANIFAQFGDGSGSFVNSTGFTASINTWYQVVYVWKNVSVNNIETFINGTSIGNVSHSLPSLLNSTNPMYIGSYNGGEFSQYMNGKIGVVRLYNSALTSDQVLQNFNADKTKYNL